VIQKWASIGMTERKARSVRIYEFGGPEVLRIEDVVVPSPGLGEVRLNVHVIGLNRTEITLRSGRSPAKPSLPTVIGFEAAGVIDEVGQASRVGTPVIVWRSFPITALHSMRSMEQSLSHRPAPLSPFLRA
jgi:NADPH:quinone reductase-like Zn-dependent oxidoreductase